MVSAAAGSVALVAAPLVHAHGVQYLFAAGVLAGCMQVLFGWLRLGVLLRFVSGSVRTGFVNALAILIFSAQMPHLVGATSPLGPWSAPAWSVIYGLPRLTTLVPSPLVCIVMLTLVAKGLGLSLKTVADLGHLPDGLPSSGCRMCRCHWRPCGSSRCRPWRLRWWEAAGIADDGQRR